MLNDCVYDLIFVDMERNIIYFLTSVMCKPIEPITYGN